MKNENRETSWWPRALVAFFVFFITSIILFIAFALRQDTHLVRADYYRAEIEHQREIDRQSRANELGPLAVIEYSARHGQLGIRIPSHHAAARAAGEVRFYRPNNPALDHNVRLAPREDGKQFIDVHHLAPGAWRVRLEWQIGELDFAKTARVVIASPAS
jgi:nitrogen fixation protein FixH